MGPTVTDAGQLEPRLDRPDLADREAVLARSPPHRRGLAVLREPAPGGAAVDADLPARLREGLPEHAERPEGVLDDAARVLDESSSPARPLYLAYIGSTGLEVGVLAEALAATYDVNLAVTARAADLVERQALALGRRVRRLPLAFGAFTSGGMTSNLTALLARRERALPGCRHDGLAGHRGAVYCSEEAHHSVVRAVEAAGLGGAAVRLPLDDLRRMRADLDAAIAADLEAGVTPSPWSPTAAPRSPAPSTRSTPSPRSAPATASGCTSTAPTACRPRPRRPAARSSRASTAPTR